MPGEPLHRRADLRGTKPQPAKENIMQTPKCPQQDRINEDNSGYQYVTSAAHAKLAVLNQVLLNGNELLAHEDRIGMSCIITDIQNSLIPVQEFCEQAEDFIHDVQKNHTRFIDKKYMQDCS